uniref:Fcf2 pre-rRNA processing C-terminal domain-containing protein n=1 Tax=Knipowitschia caucasica TaxID=637954 RepID=A0AAV2KZP2_KNICA
MVVTRRGVHVSSPSRATNTADSSISSAPQATPSTGRRTRRTANSSESPTQTTVEEASSQLEKLSQDCFVQNSARKRCTRASRLHSPDKPCTPVGSVHEEEPSDIESCCSVVSDIVAPLTRRSTRKKVEKKEEDLSEVESCSSVRRSTRKKRAPVALDSASEETDEKTRPDALGSASEEKDEKTRPDALDSASEETDEKTRADALDSASEEKDEKTRADALDSASEEKDEKTRPDALDFASEVTDEKTRADALDSASEVTDEKTRADALDSASEVTDEKKQPSEVMAGEQQQETTENLLEETLEPEMMETVEPLKKVLTSSTCDDETTEDKDDVIMVNADADTLGGSEQQDGNDDVENPEGDALVSNSEKGEVQAGVDTVTELACHIEEEQEEPIQCTSSQPTAQFSEQPPQGAAVQSKRGINLLDSSDEDDDFADEIGESSGDEAEESGEELLQSTETKVTKAAEGLFMIDTRPGEDADELYYQDRLKERGQVAEEEEEEFLDEEGDDDDHDDAADVLFSSRDPQFKALSSRIDPGLRMKQLGGLYISFDGSKSKPVSNSQQKHREKKILDEVMKRSVIGPDFEKKDAVPPCNETKKALKLKRKAERAKTTGEAWFNMKAPEITPELKGDLQLLRMRGSMDSKRFYKKNDRDGFPKYFQMGTVVDNPVDFYHSRIAKKDRKRTMVEELLADAEFRQKNKRKFQTIMAEKAAQTAGRRHKKGKFQKK